MRFLKIKYLILVLLLLASKMEYACSVKPSYSYTSSHTCGIPTIVQAVNTSTGTNLKNTKFWWKINGVFYGNDTSIGLDSAILYLKQRGNNTVRLFVMDSGNCIDSTTSTINVTTNAKTILDQNYNYTHTPVWMNCLQFIADPDSFRVNFESADTLKNLRILWGDGSMDTSRNDLLPNTIKSHLYQKLGIFNLKIITTNGNCIDTVYGTVNNQRQPTAGIIGPPSGSNRGCVPHTLRIVNNSYNISNNTVFRIDWGNGESESQPYTTLADTFYHTYKTGVCAGIIKITATNVCGSSFSTWNPIDISDKDKALWSVTKTCNPNTDFVFLNLSTDNYCLIPDIKQYYWDFGDSTNTGWIGNKASQKHRYKEEGDYTVTLITKTACGNDTFKSKVAVYYNPLAGFIYNSDRSCKPLKVTLIDTSIGRGYKRTWTVKEGNNVKTYNDSILVYNFTQAGTHSIELKVSNICGTSTQIKKFVVTEKPTAKFTKISNSCVPVTVSYTNTSISYFSNATYNWDFGDSTFSSLKSPSQKTCSKPGIYTIRLVVSDSCGSDTYTQVFTAYGLPKAIFTVDSSACTFDSVNILNLSKNSNSFYWTFGDSSDSSVTDTNAITHVYTTPGTYPITLIAGSGSGCSDTASSSIIIKPGARALFDINQTYACSPATFKFTNKSVYGKDYLWYANGKLIDTVFTLRDTSLYSDSSIVSLKLVVSSASSCQIDSFEKTFFTPKNPEAIIGNKDSGCGILTVNFINSSKFSYSSYWDLGNGSFSTSQSPQANYNPALSNDTLYHPKLIVQNWANCKDSVTSNIKVFPKPAAMFTPHKNNGCGPLDVYFTNLSKTNNLDSFGTLKHHWNFGDGNTSTNPNPLHTFRPSNSKDTFYNTKLTLTSINGCIDSNSQTIQVFPLPKINFVADRTSGCALLPVSFTNFSSPNDTGDISIMNFVWNAGNGYFGNTKEFNTVYSGASKSDTTYFAILKGYSEHGCMDSSILPITVHPQPNAVINFNTNDACTPMNITGSNQSNSNDGGPLTHYWDFGNGFISNSPIDSTQYWNNSNTDLNFNILYVVNSQHGCKDTAYSKAIVRPNPVAKFTIENMIYCAPANVKLTDSSINSIKYYWGQGNSKITGNKIEFIQLPGNQLFDTTYTIEHQVESQYGCKSDTVYQSVVVHGKPVSNFTVNKDSTCSSESISFSNNSLGAFKYNWNFGDNTISNLINPNHTFKTISNFQDTTFLVDLEVISTKGCRDSSKQTVYLIGKSNDKISLENAAGCTDLEVIMKHNSTRFKTKYWDFGDNSVYAINDSVNHVFTNATGNLSIQSKITLYRERFRCQDTIYSYVNVYPKPRADFSINRMNPCDGGEYKITDLSQYSSNNVWLIDGTITNNRSNFSVLLPGLSDRDTSYTIQLISNNLYQCADTISKLVSPKRPLKVDFSANKLISCENNPISFTSKSDNIARFYWLFGDGESSNDENPTHTYRRFGSFKVILIGFDKDGCADSSESINFIDIIEIPKADFTFLPEYPKLPNALVNFTANPSIQTVNPDDLTYDWNFGDSTYPTANKNLKDPSHTYYKDGTITISLIVSNQQCSSKIIKQLPIEYQAPIVDFTPDTLEGCVPLIVNFKSNTQYADKFRWIFGDGTPDSYDVNPKHIFELPGAWNVTLVATGAGGTKTTTKNYLIRTFPKPVIDFYTKNRYLSLPNAVFNMMNIGNSVYNEWQVFDTMGQLVESSNLRNPSFIVDRAGRFTIQLIGTNSYGCVDTLIKPEYLSTLGPGYIYVPNAFSPNNNEKNDNFSPKMHNVKERNYIFTIYNRWGEKIFETNDINGAWDGTYKGKMSPQEVYIWTVNGEFNNSDLFSRKGTVTLLK
ncbi:MAG: PKD domain-containing protein [Bacteroidia bacterium]